MMQRKSRERKVLILFLVKPLLILMVLFHCLWALVTWVLISRSQGGSFQNMLGKRGNM